MNTGHKKILVVRNDKLGDFMLTWPALATLKQSLPNCDVHALVNPYTSDMARLCPSIDHVVLDAGPEAGISRQLSFANYLRRQAYDAALVLFSTTRIGWLLLLARIPYRLAPATKIAQLFYHRRVKQRRSRSMKPEHVYNRDLIVQYLHDIGAGPIAQPQPPYLGFDARQTEQVRLDFCSVRRIPASQPLIFIHPGSGGSASNLDAGQYADLARQLKSARGHHIVLTAGPDELDQAGAVASRLAGISHSIYHSTEGLERFARHIAFADLFISGSTGPLHIAGALNRNTAAFYTRRRSATSLRWQTINSAEKHLDFSPPEGADQEDMSSIDMGRAADQISEHFLADRAAAQ